MSLRLRAVLIAGLALALLWVLAAALMMRGVHANLDRTLDGRLAMSARMVSGLLDRAALAPDAVHGDLSEAVRVTGKEGMACEIRLLRGEVMASTAGAPSSDFDFLPTGFSTRVIQGESWRVYVLRTNDYQITTADREDQRDVLVSELLYAAGVPFIIALFGGLIALWIGIGRGLAPLQALRQQLRARQPEDTRPMTVRRPPSELRPVLEAMNGLLGRLAQALSSQKAFTDAAAHELRTPLTVIDTHLQVLRLTEGEQAEASLNSAEEGVRRLRRTLDQMMSLARTEAALDQAEPCLSVRAAIEAVLQQADGGTESRVSLAMSGEDGAVSAPRSMVETMVRNLVDNALRYSPENEAVDIDLRTDLTGACLYISVADRGPGLSDEQAAQIGRRFWRGDQGRQRKDGAGLGISIVRACAERFGGALLLRPRPGGGLMAEIRLPLK